jgi:hypothetical protein
VTNVFKSPLRSAVLAATMLCPGIVRAAAKAGHGPERDRPHQLRQAIKLARELVQHLETAQASLGWTKDDAA